MSDVERVLDEALRLGDEDRWEEMAELLVAALEETGEDDPYLLCWLGVAEREAGNDGAAYEHFKRCLAADPLDPHLLAMAGSGLASFDDPEAEAALRAAALTGADVPIARLQYGAYLAREGLFDEALEHLRAAVELVPDDPVMHGELGAAHALKGDWAAASDAMEDALSLAPDDSWTRVLLGLVYLEMQRDELGAETLAQAAADRTEDGEAQILSALAAAAMGWEAAAQEALARADFAEDVERELFDEAEERIAQGVVEARSFLRETVGPVALRDRLQQPI
jgi:tetratricopeptide (TPR) repeat protein